MLFKATLEHNIHVLSKIYLNISFTAIGRLLGISAEQAESIISNMVAEGRIRGVLDQLDEIVDFTVQLESTGVQVFGGQKQDDDGDEGEQVVESRPSLADVHLHDNNSRIASVCNNIDSLLKDILKEHPHLQKYDQHVVE